MSVVEAKQLESWADAEEVARLAAPAAKEKAPAAEGSEEDAGDDVAEKPSVFPFSKDLNEKIVLWYVR